MHEPGDAVHAGPGRFVVVEGINGSGKTTVAADLGVRLDACLFHFPQEFLRFRQEVRLDTDVSPVARLAYYLAAVLHLSDLVHEALSRGNVLCDRYLASPMALIRAQGELSSEEIETMAGEARRRLCPPDVTVLLTVTHEVSRGRMHGRDLGASGASDAYGLSAIRRRAYESPAFFDRFREELRLEAARLGPMVELDTTHLSASEACESVWRLVSGHLGPQAV